jgi:hypothetical protein
MSMAEYVSIHEQTNKQRKDTVFEKKGVARSRSRKCDRSAKRVHGQLESTVIGRRTPELPEVE